MGEKAIDIVQSIEKRWETLTIADDFVFGKAMKDEGLCCEVLEAILGVTIERIEYLNDEETIDVDPRSKGVRLDVYVRDVRGVVYNVEMQAVNTRELPQRSRYYQALMSLDQLQRGVPYKSLRNSYVIFVCGFDLFGKGRRLYSFQNRCDADGSIMLGDGAHTVFLSAASPTDEQAGPLVNELLDYVASGRVTGELSSRLDEAVEKVLSTEKWRLEYMILEVRDQLNVDKGLELGLQQGIEKGREEGLELGRQQGLELGRVEGKEQGLAEGREAGLAEGREAGLAEGKAQGEELLSALILRLFADGRSADVERAVGDGDYRKRLYEEYGITA